MKLTMILLVVAIFQASANGYSQGITVSQKNISLEEALTVINKQTGYLYFANHGTLLKAKRFDLHVVDATLLHVLEICFEGQPLAYTIKDRVIIIKEKSFTTTMLVEETRSKIDAKGRVLNEQGQPVSNVTVTIKGTTTSTLTGANGEFSLTTIDMDAILVFTHVSMETFELKVSGRSELLVRLKTKISELGDVIVTVSTGYQDIPKERATGSFVKVENHTLNLQTGTNILKRLEGVASGMLFDNNKIRSGASSPRNDNISIRGLSTINASMEPLIVLDGFIYEGNISNINPNDVENITILKDAAAASIWGARAGNGVIVINTKKGMFNQKPRLEFNSNVIISQKPDLYNLPEMSSSDYIDVEEFLFSKGFFNSRINTGYLALTPGVDIFLDRRNGLISVEDSTSLINTLKGIDTRDQYNKYIYKRAVTQQYSANLRGGTHNNAYIISVGFDRNMWHTSSTFEKLNIRIEDTYQPIKNLQANFSVLYTNSKGMSGIPEYGSFGIAGRSRVPYIRLADNNGSALAVPFEYAHSYLDTVGGGELLDWKYYPLEDWKHSKTTTKTNEIYASLGIQYKFTKFLNIDLRYQYQNQNSDADQLNSIESYYTRSLINTFSQLDRTTGIVTYIVPKGGIRNLQTNLIGSHTARGQLNFNLSEKNHSIVAILGAEIRQLKNDGHSFTSYGYNEDPLVSGMVDFRNTYPTFITGSYEGLSGTPSFGSNVYRFVSMYANASYTYKGRYVVSASGRKDGSNIFGVKTNDRWKPLWSIGAVWKISNESFYNSQFLSFLSLRTTFGYSGNVDLSRSALPIGTYFIDPNTNFPATRVAVLNNPALRWEKSGIFNIGVDFRIGNGDLSGSIEYYTKNGTDLYGPSLYDYTVWGYSNEVTINSANLRGYGVDFVLNAQIFKNGFKWNTALLFNYNANKVTKYYGTSAERVATKIGSGVGIAPVIGKPLYALAAYRWGGLDANGNPQGYVDGQLSTDYRAIFNEGATKGVEGNVVYFGPSSPPIFGSLTNSFSLKGFTLTVLVSYKFAYYFKKSFLSYQQLVNGGRGHKDFENRWKKPGDEQITDVPSFVYPLNSNNNRRDNFYGTSEVQISKADHIRLQVVNLSYSIIKSKPVKLPLNELQIYVNAANLGILWRANTEKLDPEFPSSIAPVKSWTFGIRATF